MEKKNENIAIKSGSMTSGGFNNISYCAHREKEYPFSHTHKEIIMMQSCFLGNLIIKKFYSSCFGMQKKGHVKDANNYFLPMTTRSLNHSQKILLRPQAGRSYKGYHHYDTNLCCVQY